MEEAEYEYERDKSMIMQECNSYLDKKGCDEENYPCSECPLVFDKAIDRFNHITTVHIPGKYSCVVCDMKFPNSHDLKSHNLVHQNGSGMFECEICGKLVTSATSLRDTSNFHMTGP